MIPLLTAFAGGLLGSSHCVGMCGGFVLALGATGRAMLSNLYRQVLYGLGRVFTYAVGGIAAGYGGQQLMHEFHWVTNGQAVLSITAGVLLVGEGLAAAGLLPRFWMSSRQAGCASAGLFGALLRETRLRHVFLGGMVNGFLPCGLVYAYLALAAGTGGMWQGGLLMLLFGLGTLPVLTLLGVGGQALSLVARRRILRIAAWCVIAAGVMSIVRGVNAVPRDDPAGAEGCPACRTATPSVRAA